MKEGILLASLDEQPSLSSIKPMREKLCRVLNKLNIANKEVDKVLLALSEVTTNIIQHAVSSASYIGLRVIKFPDKITFEVEDDGSHFDGFNQSKQLSEAPIFGESGMGLNIVYSLFSDCSYQRNDQHNVFAFFIPYQSRMTKSVRIAVVEDEPMMREIVKGYLPAEYDLVMFEDGQQFLDEVKGQAFDLVISDISMPNVDGLTLKKELTTDAQLAQIPFIFLTAQDDVDIETQANRLGIDNYLVKPVQKDKLRMSVERTLIRHQQIEQQQHAVFDDALMPALERNIPNYQAEVRSISPFAGGGDFIFQREVNGQTLLILADVMGHNVTSKLFAHSFSGFFSGFIENTKSFKLTDMVTALSNQIFEDPLLSKSLVTCIALLINEHEIEVVVAGHPSLIHFTDKNYCQAPIEGHLPGVGVDIEYQSSIVRLNKGERILLYTDGFTDWVNNVDSQSTFFSELLAIMVKYNNDDVTQIANHWLACFEAQCPHPKDDVTMVVIEKN